MQVLSYLLAFRVLVHDAKHGVLFRRSLYWPLRLRRDPCNMSPLPIGPIYDGRMRRHPIIPNHNRPWGPFHPALYVLTECHMIEQKFQQVITLLLL